MIEGTDAAVTQTEGPVLAPPLTDLEASAKIRGICKSPFSHLYNEGNLAPP